MLKSDAFIVNRIVWKARRCSLPGNCSFFFNDLSTSMQHYLSDQLVRDVSGTPVLLFIKPTREWTLICTRQVIGNDIHNTTCINLNEIKDITATAIAGIRLGQKVDIQSMKKKTEWDTLNVADKQGNVYVLHTDKGGDLFALWNILRMVVGFYS